MNNQHNTFTYHASRENRRAAKNPAPPGLSERLLCVQDFEDHAVRYLPKASYDFMAAGAMEGQSTADNRLAFKRSV